MWYASLHIQKDGRINLGTRIHSDPTCTSIKDSAAVYQIDGDIVTKLPTCKLCSISDSEVLRSVTEFRRLRTITPAGRRVAVRVSSDLAEEIVAALRRLDKVRAFIIEGAIGSTYVCYDV